MSEIMKVSKNELKDRLKFRCEHGHNGIGHKNCFDVANNIVERIGFFDIEAEDLNADYGVMFSYCILDQNNKLYSDMLTLADIQKYKSTKRDIEPKEDSRILQSLIRDLGNFDRVIGHYSCGYDLPFIRTRAVICDIPFPEYGTLYQSDTWVILKKKFKLSRNSLMNGALKLVGATRKDHLSLSVKHGVLRGEEWAKKITHDHCYKDVLDTRDLYNKISPYLRKTKSSI